MLKFCRGFEFKSQMPPTTLSSCAILIGIVKTLYLICAIPYVDMSYYGSPLHVITDLYVRIYIFRSHRDGIVYPIVVSVYCPFDPEIESPPESIPARWLLVRSLKLTSRAMRTDEFSIRMRSEEQTKGNYQK